MTIVAGSHWSDHTWKLLACVRGRKGEADFAYINQDDCLTLLVRAFPSLTDRRLTQTRKIQAEGDFTWIVMAPKRMARCEASGGIEILDEARLAALLRQNVPH